MSRLYSKRIDNCRDCPNCGEAMNIRFLQPICWEMEGVREDNWLEWGDWEAEAPEHIPVPDWCPLPEVQEAQG